MEKQCMGNKVLSEASHSAVHKWLPQLAVRLRSTRIESRCPRFLL